MQNKNHNIDEKPYIQEVDDPHSYENIIKVYRFFNKRNLIIFLLVVFGLKFAYDHRRTVDKDTGVVIYHSKEQVKYQDTTLYFTHKSGTLKLYHGKSDWEAENDSYIQFHRLMNGSLREMEGLDFVRYGDFDYYTVARAFITESDSNSIKFTTALGLPFFWTTLFGVILIVEPRVALILYTPIALFPARGVGIPDLPRYDPDVNYKLGGQVLLGISFVLFIPFIPSFIQFIRGLW